MIGPWETHKPVHQTNGRLMGDPWARTTKPMGDPWAIRAWATHEFIVLAHASYMDL